MNESTSWMQSNWYPLGTLLIQLGFLAAGVWFAQKLLRALRASQEQVGALLKLSVSGALTERHSPSSVAGRALDAASPYWLTPAEPVPPVLSEPLESGPSRWAVVWHGISRGVLHVGHGVLHVGHGVLHISQGLLHWLQAPMSGSWFAPWRRVIRWLQAPARS